MWNFVPSEQSLYNFTTFTSEGYFVLAPDIVYEAREPGRSALGSVEAAVEKVKEKELIDPKGVGLVGHSWGGYQAKEWIKKGVSFDERERTLKRN